MKSADLFPAVESSMPASPRQFKVEPISKKVAAAVYSLYHYYGDKDFLNLYSFGALFEGEVIAAVSYGIPNAKEIKGLYSKGDQSGVLELTRLAAKPECPRNTPSRLISQSLKLLRQRYPLKLVITYADTAQNHEGTIYKASNFEYHGLTAQKTDFVFPDGKIKKVKGLKYSEAEGEWVKRSRKHLYSMQFIINTR